MRLLFEILPKQHKLYFDLLNYVDINLIVTLYQPSEKQLNLLDYTYNSLYYIQKIRQLYVYIIP